LNQSSFKEKFFVKLDCISRIVISFVSGEKKKNFISHRKTILPKKEMTVQIPFSNFNSRARQWRIRKKGLFKEKT